jgi:RNA-directed DNA polymerase
MHRSHPNKSNSWLKEKYFRHKQENGFNNKWVFYAHTTTKKGVEIRLELLQLKWFKHIDHIMVRNDACPDDPSKVGYFQDLKSLRMVTKKFSVFSRFDADLASAQDFICPVCGDELTNGEKIHKHHILPRSEGGKDVKSNLVLLHLMCHYKAHNEWNKDKYTKIFLDLKKPKGSSKPKE